MAYMDCLMQIKLIVYELLWAITILNSLNIHKVTRLYMPYIKFGAKLAGNLSKCHPETKQGYLIQKPRPATLMYGSLLNCILQIRLLLSLAKCVAYCYYYYNFLFCPFEQTIYTQLFSMLVVISIHVVQLIFLHCLSEYFCKFY